MLATYLQAEAGRRYELGSADCVTLTADWIERQRGLAQQTLAPRYATPAEVAEIVAGWGGLARVMGRILRRSGIPMTRDPQPGDIAFVALQDGAGVAAIRTQSGWIVRLEGGLARLSPEAVRVVAAWSV